jgi:hypothetical protein
MNIHPKTRRHDVEVEDQEAAEREDREADEPEPLDSIVEGDIPDEDEEIVDREKEDE